MCGEELCYNAGHDLQGKGCDLEHFVVECDQQCRDFEQAGKGGVGVVVGRSGVAAVCLGWIDM